MVWPVLALVLVGFVVALPVTAVLVRIGHRSGALDSAGSAGHEKLELRPVPNIGGIAIFLGVALPTALGLLALRLVPEARWADWLPELAPHLDRAAASTPTAVALLAGALVLHATGLVDDRRGLGPLLKLGVQAAVAAALAWWFDVRLLTLLGDIPSVLVTVVWIIVVTNAINFLDNMDGLAGGVGAIAAALLMGAALVNHQWFIAGVLALLAGALGGFLVFNFPPARIFMGDGGSLVVGFLLSVLTARMTFYDPSAGGQALGTAWYGVLMPVVILAVPLYDFTSVTLIRLAQGRSPFVGDQQHFSHRLVARGLSKRGAVILIWGAAAITGIGGVALGRLLPWQAALVGAQTVIILATIAAFEHASRRVPRGDAPVRP